MKTLPISLLSVVLALGVAACASSDSPREPRSARAEEEREKEQRSGPALEAPDAATVVDGNYLRPNVTANDGKQLYLHVTPADMPWVVAIGFPKRPPKYGSRKDARKVAIEAIQMWEDAIQPHVPWFELAFLEEDPDAAVQVEWKRRITGPWAGFGGFAWQTRGEELRVTGRMEVSTTPDNFQTLEMDELAVLFTHEFGHVLGLGHCLECDSAMNYAWNTRERVFVTDLDRDTFLALLAQPNAIGGYSYDAEQDASQEPE